MDSDKIININADNYDKNIFCKDIYETRDNFYNITKGPDSPEVSITVISLNRLDKTKNCIESLLQNTQDVNYELILVDNGSEDGTLEYFKNIDYDKKTIIAISKNTGLGFAIKQVMNIYSGKFFCLLSNDLILTKNWLSNLLKCIKSDNKIGLVNPKSTNVSNFQALDNFQFTSIQDLMQKAERFNISDSSKWAQQVRIITLGALFRRSALDIVGTFDVGFVHNFSEDDICTRLRRAGYKIFLCGDVMIHHDHIFTELSQEEERKYIQNILDGKSTFNDKYYGLDAWDDSASYFVLQTQLLPAPKRKSPRILGVDARMGMPILDICNFLRQNDIYNFEVNAFTQNAKYYLDLQTICGKRVICDRIEHIDEYYEENSFDYIIIGVDISQYEIADELIEYLRTLLKSSGILICQETENEDHKFTLITK